MEEEKAYEDFSRQRKIERGIENNKKHWLFEREYLGRNMLQWFSLYFGLILIIITLRHNIFTIGDILLMVTAGFHIAIWILGGMMNNIWNEWKDTLKIMGKMIDTMKQIDDEDKPDFKIQ